MDIGHIIADVGFFPLVGAIFVVGLFIYGFVIKQNGNKDSGGE